MYGNGFLDDFSGYGGLPAATSYAQPMSQPAAYGGLPAAAAQPAAPAMTPELLQQIQQGAALAGRSPLFNAAGGLSTLQPGTLSPLDPLYNYAKTAPILSLTGNKEYENLNFQALPDTNYRLTIGGQVVGSASTPEEVARLVEYANSASKSGGAKVDVRLQKEVQTATPEGQPSTAFADVYANQPNNNGFLDVALPAALAAMGAGVIGLPGAFAKGATALVPGALGAGLGAAGGMFAGSLGTGASLETALTKAAIAGLSAGALSGLSGAAPVPGGTAPGLDIALNAPVAGLGGGVMSLPAFVAPSLSGLGGAIAGSVPGEILVQAARNAVSPALSGLGGAALSTGISNLSPTLPQVSDMLGRQTEPAATEDPEIVVDITKNPVGIDSALAAAAGAAAANALGPENAQTLSERAVEQPKEQAQKDGTKSTIGKVLTGLSALDTITGLLGINTGGGKGGGAGSLGTGAGAIGTASSLNPVFGAQLPAARGNFAPQSFAPRDMSGVDFARYGYSPAQSFFENVPRTPAEYRAALAANTPVEPMGYIPPGNEVANYVRRMAPGATDAQIADYMRSPVGQQMSQFAPKNFAEGGMFAAKGGSAPRKSRAVNGAGTGRSDEIPALLSDGEYVIDAETVAMLGDGSGKAGAERLDDLRVNIRKHKGRNLAKGKFSANAKRPENYLSGGRV